MSRWIGFGKETVPGRAVRPNITFPVVGMDQEMCEICGRIDTRENMHYLTEGDGIIVYVCDDAHPTKGAE